MIVVEIVILAVGFFMLMKGADWFVEGTSGIAYKLGIPQLVVGLTIVAMGTSAPEAAVSITAALKGNADISVGNVVGSNILNVLIILGVTAVITNVAIQKSTLQIEIPYMIGITLVFIFLGKTGNYITRTEGMVLWIFFLMYLGYLYELAKKGEQEDVNEIKDRSVGKLVLYAVVGLVIVIAGSNLTVSAATEIAQMIGLSERFIGLTIVALGTSLPELVTSVTAARRGNAGIAIGNIVGSNIFNILFVIGTASLITPVLYASNFIIDGFVAVGAGILLWLAVFRHRELRRPWGVAMLLGYVAYLVYLFV